MASKSRSFKTPRPVKTLSFAFYGKEALRPFQSETPDIEPGGVLLRVNGCGICGSDLRMFFDGPSPRYKLPVVPGHEFTGTVVEVGAEVRDLKPGDVVAVGPLIPCMRCAACGRGQDNLCENGRVIGVHTPGGLSDHFYMPEQMARAGAFARYLPGADLSAAALTENVACCLHGLRQTEFQPGDSVLIIGNGPIGLTFVQLLRLMGAGRIVVTGRREKRLRLAEELGADVVLDASRYELKQYAGDNSFRPDLAVVAAAAVPESQTALDLVRSGGSLLLFSGYPASSTMPLDLYPFHYGEKHIHGAIDCTLRDFHDAARLMPQLQMGKLVTHHFPLREAPEAFRAAREGEAVKVLLEP